jgi:hypothetical protein
VVDFHEHLEEESYLELLDAAVEAMDRNEAKEKEPDTPNCKMNDVAQHVDKTDDNVIDDSIPEIDTHNEIYID